MSRDLVADYIAPMNAAAAAKPNPLVPRRTTTPRPEKTGNPLDRYIALQRWRAENAPNPLKGA